MTRSRVRPQRDAQLDLSKLDRPWPRTFRVYANGGSSGLYVIVNVWPTKRALHERLLSAGYAYDRQTQGHCASYTRINYRRNKPRLVHKNFATIDLYFARLTMRIVTHELMHAAFAWARRMGYSDGAIGEQYSESTSVTPEEERICTAHGLMCMQFVERAKRAGLYE